MNNNNEYDIKFIILSLIFCTSSILLNIYCMKVLAVKTFVVGDCGIVVSWIIFLTNNLLTKNYGEKNTIKVIKVSNCIGFVVPVVSYLLTLLPVPTDYQDASDAFSMIFSSSLRVITASSIAYFVGNVFYTKMVSKNKNNIFISMLGQLIDNFIFAILAFAPIHLSQYEMRMIDIVKSAIFGAVVESILERIFLFFVYRSDKIK